MTISSKAHTTHSSKLCRFPQILNPSFLGVNVFLAVFSCCVSQIYADNQAIEPSIDLQVADGQGGNLLDKQKEDSPGAFTVANKNDTDLDGTVDMNDNYVGGEIDLMKLVFNPPVPNNDPNRNVSLTVPANAKIYKSSDKKAGLETKRIWKASELPITRWIEMQDASSAVRADEFGLSSCNVSDTVRVTGIWATLEQTYIQGNSVPADLDDASLKNAIQQLELGLKFWASNHPFEQNWWGAQVGILYEWEIRPAGLENEAKVKIDLSRQAETKASDKAPNGTWQIRPAKTFPQSDIPNDDSGIASEDEIPKNLHIYNGDWPGAIMVSATNPQVGTEMVARGNLL